MSQPMTKDSAKPKPRRSSGGATVAAMFGEGLGSLHEAPAPAAAGVGLPQALPLALIDEDPEQPRVHFDGDALQELADTIAERGVKTPISVRPHPTETGRYMINHGARRFRASKMAGRDSIPAYLDTDHTAADQVIENLQRDGLTPREIADFIGRELAKGRKKGDIAKSIGKSPAYVSQHVTLLELPGPVADAMAGGKVRDVTLIVELARLAKIDEAEVATHINLTDEITRAGVRTLREWIESRDGQGEEEAPQPRAPATKDDAEGAEEKRKATRAARFAGTVQVLHEEKPATLLLDQEPTREGHGFIRYEDGERVEVALNELEIVAIGGR